MVFFSLFERKLFFILTPWFINYNSIGLLVILFGFLFFISAIIFMRESWRVGIDKKNKNELITNGIYKYSRNPAFVGFGLIYIGVFILYPNFVTFFNMILNLIFFHLLILQEEKHLKVTFSYEYTIYKQKTARYFIY